MLKEQCNERELNALPPDELEKRKAEMKKEAYEGAQRDYEKSVRNESDSDKGSGSSDHPYRSGEPGEDGTVTVYKTASPSSKVEWEPLNPPEQVDKKAGKVEDMDEMASGDVEKKVEAGKESEKIDFRKCNLDIKTSSRDFDLEMAIKATRSVPQRSRKCLEQEVSIGDHVVGTEQEQLTSVASTFRSDQTMEEGEKTNMTANKKGELVDDAAVAEDAVKDNPSQMDDLSTLSSCTSSEIPQNVKRLYHVVRNGITVRDLLTKMND